MPFSALKQLWEALGCYESQNQFPAGKLSTMRVNELSAISSFTGRPMDMGEPHILA
jgi:hypothetical protein